MRQSLLIPLFSKRRLSLFALAVVMTVLALVSKPRPAFASGCLPYCTDWAALGECCFSRTTVTEKYHRQCTDGVGHYCDEYMCSGPCFT
ncbi:MAG TPA: hypothetical protein VIJ02_03600 [Thermoanaerobaculia bacterium]|jgi:hypothetical protein